MALHSSWRLSLILSFVLGSLLAFSCAQIVKPAWLDLRERIFVVIDADGTEVGVLHDGFSVIFDDADSRPTLLSLYPHELHSTDLLFASSDCTGQPLLLVENLFILGGENRGSIWVGEDATSAFEAIGSKEGWDGSGCAPHSFSLPVVPAFAPPELQGLTPPFRVVRRSELP